MSPVSAVPVHRLLAREADSAPFRSGAHRSIRVPGEDSVLKIAVADRPALSGLVPRLFREAAARSVAAATPLGAYWLNNKGLTAYLSRVPDAVRLAATLRRVGLSDRFQGGFLIGPHEFDSMLPILASQPFCGGPDVYFAALESSLLVTACHEFDLHVETTDADLASRLDTLVRSSGLEVRTPGELIGELGD